MILERNEFDIIPTITQGCRFYRCVYDLLTTQISHTPSKAKNNKKKAISNSRDAVTTRGDKQSGIRVSSRQNVVVVVDEWRVEPA